MSNSPRYGSNSRDTSKWVKDLLNEYTKMPRGVFNLSHRKIVDVPIFGIIPFDTFEMLPGSEMYLKYDVQMLSKNPLIKRMFSGMHIELATYKIDYNDTWEGWNNFITKGRSGKVSKSIPYVDFSLNSADVTTCLPYNPVFLMNMAPAVFLAPDTDGKKFTFEENTGVKATTYLQSTGLTGIESLSDLKSSTAMRISALPLVLYNKICKKYQNSNLLQNNPHWYPENENHDNILPYSATGAVTTSDYDNPTKAFVSGTSEVLPSAELNSETELYESYPWLNVLQFANRKGTYLNSGSPFPDLIRGDIPTLQLLTGTVDFSNSIGAGSEIGTPIQADNFKSWILGNDSQIANIIAMRKDYLQGQKDFLSDISYASNIGGSEAVVFDSKAGNDRLLAVLNRATVAGLEFSMRQWRYLATMTVMKERLALTDGSYNQMIKAMFGHNPNWHEHEPQFCGGSTQPIVFSEVVNQTSSDSAPLGETAGRAVTSSQNNTIHVKSDDFGCYISVLVIVPDEYECQGVKKMWSRLENAEQYFPILNNLSPDATKNKEAFVSGTNATDEDVFNYNERFAYYKSEANEVSGLMALPISKIGDTGAYVQNRILESTPEFSQEYIRGVLTDNEKAVFASTNQAEFCAVIGVNKKYIAPIPEDSRPSDMGISY